jgi:hypothetical protein
MSAKWISFEDDGFMDQRVTHIEGLRPATNSHHHGVVIFSKKTPEHRWSSRKRTRHTLSIHMDAFGETVHSETLPFGIHIREVKEKAEALLEKYRAEGRQIVSD